MKLQIKTINQKSLIVDIEESQTVYELKKELSLYSDVGVKPELQKLIYAGKVLDDEEKLSTYNIDVKKILVIMILKQPLEKLLKATQQPQQETVVEKSPKDKQQTQQKSTAAVAAKANEKVQEALKVSSTATTTQTEDIEFQTPTAPIDPKRQAIVTQIVRMGYPETEVIRALKASFYNPERAIEYLIEGIPTSPSTPEGEDSDTEVELMDPLEMFRGDTRFKIIRNALLQNPEVFDAAIQSIGDRFPDMLNLINENQEEFLRLITEDVVDGDSGDNECMDDNDD